MRQRLQLTNAFTDQLTCAVILARSANQSTPPLDSGVQCLILSHGHQYVYLHASCQAQLVITFKTKYWSRSDQD